MSEPIYLQILHQIKDQIHEGKIKPDEMLKSENAYCEDFCVSRMTIRKSLSVLANEGYIYSKRGKGYYVSNPNIDKYIFYYNETNNTEGVSKESLMTSVDVIKPTIEIMMNLQIPKNKYVITIKRVLMKQEKPMGYDIKYIPYTIGTPIVEKEIHYSTFPEMMAKKKSLFAIKKELKIKSVLSNPELNKVLKLNDISAIMLIEQKLFDEKDKPIGWGLTYYIGDYYNIMAKSSFSNKNSTIF